MKVWPSKDPDEELRYTATFAPDLAPGEVLVAVDGDANPYPVVEQTVPAGVTISATQQDQQAVTLLLADGNNGEEAQFTIRVHTSTNNTFEMLVALPIIANVEPVDHPGDYTPPTSANLLALYPEFAQVRPSLIDYYLQRAARSVDESWTEGDFGYGRMTLAAHLMTLAGQGTSAEALSVANGSGQFRSMAIGTLRLERFDAARDTSKLSSTRYGTEYARLLRLNRGGARVTGSVPTLGRSDGDKAWY